MPRLHFGCFNCPQEGWINTDVTPHLYVARFPGLAWMLYRFGKMTGARYAEHQAGIFRKIEYLNVARSWHFPDSYLEAIYSSHVLEHLTLSGARVCLREAYRCLRSGGAIRLSVPDLDAHVASYSPEDALLWATNFFEANESSEKNMHHFMYNFESLSQLMKEAGFVRVERRAYREGHLPEAAALDNRAESLFVEATKP